MKLLSEESLLPAHVLAAKLDKIFSDLEACAPIRAAQTSPRRSRMTAQQAVKVAIAVAEVAATERIQ